MPPLSQPEEPKSPPPAIAYVIGTLIFVAILLGIWWLRPTDDAMPNPENVEGVGTDIDYMKLLPLTGHAEPVSLSELKNRVVLINFWGTWCGPCCMELPHLADLSKRFAGRETFRLLAVSCPQADGREDVESLRENTATLLRQRGVDLATYYDPQSATRRNLGTLLDLRVFPFPTTLLVDRRGTIRAIWFGYRNGIETEMERYVGKVLDEEKPGEKGEGRAETGDTGH